MDHFDKMVVLETFHGIVYIDVTEEEIVFFQTAGYEINEASRIKVRADIMFTTSMQYIPAVPTDNIPFMATTVLLSADNKPLPMYTGVRATVMSAVPNLFENDNRSWVDEVTWWSVYWDRAMEYTVIPTLDPLEDEPVDERFAALFGN